MIDQRSDEEEFGVLIVRSSTGMLVSVYWGSRYDICDSVDEVTDPNDCEFQIRESGGILFGCFLGDKEISVDEYAQQEERPEITCEGFADRSFGLFSTDDVWLPLVPRGYQYIAGFGLQKIESEWN